MQETQDTQVRSLGWEDPLEKKMATHSNILAWKAPWTERLVQSRLQSRESQRLSWTQLSTQARQLAFKQHKPHPSLLKTLSYSCFFWSWMWIGTNFSKIQGWGPSPFSYMRKKRREYPHTHTHTHTHTQRERNTFYKSKSSESLSYSPTKAPTLQHHSLLMFSTVTPISASFSWK